jgi:hypothetical protein
MSGACRCGARGIGHCGVAKSSRRRTLSCGQTGRDPHRLSFAGSGNFRGPPSGRAVAVFVCTLTCGFKLFVTIFRHCVVYRLINFVFGSGTSTKRRGRPHQQEARWPADHEEGASRRRQCRRPHGRATPERRRRRAREAVETLEEAAQTAVVCCERPLMGFIGSMARSGHSLVRRSITFEICTRNVAPLLANHELAGPRRDLISSIRLS